MATMGGNPYGTDRNRMKAQMEKGYSQLDTSSIAQKGGDTAASGAKPGGMSDAGKMQLAATGVQAAVGAMGASETDSTAGAVGGAASGAATGAAVGGPWGAAIGGVVGGIAGGLSAESKRRAQNRQIKAQSISQQGTIAQRKGEVDANILGGLAANLSRTLV